MPPLNADVYLPTAHPWGINGPDGKPLGFADRGDWPARWIYLPEAREKAGTGPVVVAYRQTLNVDEQTTLRFYISADERYDLFLDGQRIGRGPERGDPRHWYYDAYDVPLAPGGHVLVARVWSLGIGLAPWSQVGLKHGLLVAAQDPRWNQQLATGTAPWQAKRLRGYQFRGAGSTAWASVEEIDARDFSWDFATGAGESWQNVKSDRNGRSARESSFVHTFEHALYPPRLAGVPEQRFSGGVVRHVDDGSDAPRAYRAAECRADELPRWSALLVGGASVTVPAGTRRRVLIDLQTYLNAYPSIVFDAGRNGEIRLAWAEALQRSPTAHDQKQQRDRIEDVYVNAVPDVIRPHGAPAEWQPLWWRCGRYVQLEVTARDEPLVIHRIAFDETRYPLEERGSFACDDDRVNTLMKLCLRSAQCCAHESYMDCPYYEQQMWVGDMRVQMLISYTLSGDPGLARRCIEYIGETRDAEAMVFGRYPAPQRLWIPSFALAWVAMLHDFGRYHGEPAFIARMMPAARGTLDAMLAHPGDDALLRTPAGWNYVDWSSHPAWQMGEPPNSIDAPSAIHNLQVVHTLQMLAELERWLGEPELAARWQRLADALWNASHAAFWNNQRGLFADDPRARSYSEHAQALAVLCGRLRPEAFDRIAEGWSTPDVARTSYYFDCFLLEALREMRRPDAFFHRLQPYFQFADQGFRTTPEKAEPTRSDCHAWSAHPRYHVIASVLGIRPAAWSFERVHIRPMLGPLAWASGTVPHPRGQITVDLHRDGPRLRGHITLPPGLTGELIANDHPQQLHSGKQEVA